MELVRVDDIFENEEVTLMESEYKLDDGSVINIDVGLKDSTGDICRIITVKSRLILNRDKGDKI